ncbi:acylphosphatase [Oribacterium sp. KHPX15]|nr:acylphosphatase [Oribacterium sp. KHPX15]SDZ89016.1 acylphosphatase [Oribacterium sp. KHPX15]
MLFDFLKKYSDQFDNSSSKDGAAPAAGNAIRKHIVFYGTVQGVGFRYTAYHLASSLGLTGWARNEDDGSVTCELQGSSVAIQEFMNRIGNQRFIEITDKEERNINVIKEERSFRVLY